MQDYTRRTLLQGGTALAATGALTGPALFDFAKAWAQASPWKAERGAKLTVMRWKRFVPTEAAALTCKQGNDWLGIPVATIGGYMTYRKSAVDKAGFKEFPTDFPGFLAMCKALKANNTPAGFALGHATGDANGWLHWILWGHGAYTVDKSDKVIINSPETAKALDYCKALSDTFISGVASWNDSSNNKAFLAGDLYCTINGISIYVAAKDDPTKKDLAEDTYHALMPVGPVGKPTELQLAVP